jgi:hypothetical protein
MGRLACLIYYPFSKKLKAPEGLIQCILAAKPSYQTVDITSVFDGKKCPLALIPATNQTAR